MPRFIKAFFPAFALLGACSTVDEINPKPDGGPEDAGLEDAGPEDAGNDAESGLVCPASGVTKGPWSFAIDGTSAKIRWEACRMGSAAEVIFAPEKGGTEAKAASVESAFKVTETYTAPLSVGAPPDYAGTYYMHEAALTGLSPATCYAYHLAADASLSGRFCTARASGDSFTFMAIGDTNPGLGTYSADVLKHSLPKNPDFIVHGGDIQYYASGLETWASWFPVMQPMLSAGGFFPAVGNHESETPDEYEQYTTRFFGGAGFDVQNGHYRFSSGGVWFFSLDTEESLDDGSPQTLWLTKELADAAAQPGYRFSVVYFHKPWVTCGDTGDNPAARTRFEPLFTQYKVALIIQAHMHGYERFELGEFTYLTAAGGGGTVVNVDLNISRPYCGMRVFSGGFRHAVILDVKPGMLTGTMIDDQGMVRDTFSKVVP